MTLVVSDSYLKGFVVTSTSPTSTREHQQGISYFRFGPLSEGKSGEYTITIQPTTPGEYRGSITLATWGPFGVLVGSDGSELEFALETGITVK